MRSELIGMRGHTSLFWGYNPFWEMRTIHQTGRGTAQFFLGLDSALAGRCLHLLVRNGLYKTIYDRYKPKKAHNDLTIREKSVLAAFSGAVAALVSNPLEVAMVRQIAAGTLPKAIRPDYSSLGATWATIVRQEGLARLFT